MPTTEAETTPRLACSVPDACDALGIGRNTFYEEVRKKRLVVKKCGRRTLVPTAQFESWLANLPNKAA